MGKNHQLIIDNLESIREIPDIFEAVDTSFTAFYKVSEVISSLMTAERIEQYQKNENEIMVLSIFISRQIALYRMMHEHFSSICDSLKSEVLFETYERLSNEIAKMTNVIEKKFPQDMIEKCLLIAEKKRQYDELLMMEKEVSDYNEEELTQKVSKLKVENAQKKSLISEMNAMEVEKQKLEQTINLIDTSKVSTSDLLKSIAYLIEQIKSSKIGNEALLKARTIELDQEKSSLANIETQLKKIEKIQNKGFVGIEVSRFFPDEFDSSRIDKLKREIDSISDKLKELIDKKERMANLLKESE